MIPATHPRLDACATERGATYEAWLMLDIARQAHEWRKHPEWLQRARKVKEPVVVAAEEPRLWD